MRKLDFSAIMDFCKPHNQSMFQKIVVSQRDGTLSPFVGAGLSVPFGYALWGSVLRKLAENIQDDVKKKSILEQIESCAYEAAAGSILEEYPFMLDQLPDIVSPDILARCPDEKKRTSAAWVLPYLFRKGFVMTTNFDRVLEHMYLTHQSEAIPVVTPVDQDRLAQLRQNQALSLFKLHGDIGSEAVSIEDLVFTEEQYNKHYAMGSALTEELARCFSNRRLLFLGCSLNADRTMQVLQQVALSQKGIRHFAILGCKKSEIPKRSKELAALGILPIFYDDSDHDAVRVILERLLEETDRDGYQQLIRSSRVTPPIPREERSLLFDADYFPFSGREEELMRLEDYTAAEEQILWWAVTGPGGMGKSRLVYEFCNKKREAGWCTERFEAHPSRESNARSLEELTGWTPPVKKTIVVLDDVQAHMDTVCGWITAQSRCSRSEQLRILLLERDGKNLTDASWLNNDPRCDDLEQWCHDETFLHLEPMQDDHLLEIMNSYAAAAGKTLNTDLLLNTLERVDPELKRPLYAIALADARCQGKDPTNWDRGKILDALLSRELEFHFSRLQGLGKLSKTLKTELECLLAEACIPGFLPLDQVDWPKYDKLRKRMDTAEMDPEEFFDRLGVLRTEQVHVQKVDQYGAPVEDSVQEKELKVIALICPDLIKEHLVLNLAFEKKKLELLPDGWEWDPNRLLFLHRLWSDYPERLKDQQAFWDRFFGVDPPTGFPGWLYSNLLWGCTDLFRDHSQRAVNTLAGLYQANEDDGLVAASYAKGLYNLSNKQAPADRAATVDRLEALYSDHPGNDEIAVTYAMGLVNLAHDQDPRCCAATVDRLEVLYSDHPSNDEVAVQYAKGLLNLAHNQAQADRAATVDRLEVLYSVHSGNHEIAVAYAMSLLYLSCDQAPENRATAVDQLEILYSDHSGNDEIAVAYAMSLLNLSCVQAPEDQTATMDRLKSLYTDHPGNEEVAVQYANGLYNLSCVQTPEDQATTVDRLKSLYSDHPGNEEIATQYANGLFNLSCVQTPEDRASVVDRLEVLYSDHPGNDETAAQYAKGLVNLALFQTEEADVLHTLTRSNALREKHPGDAEIQLCHAQTWFNLTLVQKEADIPATVAGIAAFLREHSAAIPGFREALTEYLSKHPDHAARYQPLLELGGAADA